jgi:hypothetical protein
MVSFTCLASVGGFYTFDLQIDGTTVDTIYMCINIEVIIGPCRLVTTFMRLCP